MRVADICFHDSSLLDVKQGESSLELLFELTDEFNGKHVAVELLGVSSILCDETYTATFKKETADAEVLKVWEDGGSLKLLIIWNDYLARTNTTRYHEIRFDELRVSEPLSSC